MEYKYLKNDTEISDEVKRVLTLEDNYDGNAISLYSVLDTIADANQKLNLTKKEYQNHFKRLLKQKYQNPVVSLHDIPYDVKELTMDFTADYYTNRSLKPITFSENDLGIYVKEDKTGCADGIIKILRNEIVTCYFDIFSNSSFLRENKKDIRSLNSDFLVTIDRFGVLISNEKARFGHDFYFMAYSGFGYPEKGQYDYNPKLSKAFMDILGNEKKLLKKIFVEIENCPEWSKEILYQKREKELNGGNIKTKILSLFK